MIALLRPDNPRSAPSDAELALPDDVRAGMPDAGWARDELDRRAEWEVDKTRRKHGCAAAYWWLAKVMEVIEADFKTRRDKPGWADWQRQHDVNRTRAYRCELYLSAFESADDLKEMAIKQADRLARERSGKAEPQTEEEQRIRRRLLRAIRKAVPDSLKDLAAVPDPSGLLPLMAEFDGLCREFQAAVERKLAAMNTAAVEVAACDQASGTRERAGSVASGVMSDE